MVVNSWSVLRAEDFLNCFSTLTTVCGSSSRLIQVIFSPDFTVKVWGVKWKSLITIWFFVAAPGPFASFISPAIAKRARLRKLIPQSNAVLLFFLVSLVIVKLVLLRLV